MRTGIIVDDAAVMRMRLRDILEPTFSILAEAENGEQAIEAYNLHKPDFVTLDITMPEMGGLDALEHILGSHPDAKIVIVSAVGQKQIVFQALSKGAKDFIVKPFDPERVLLSIERLFQ